MAGPEGYVLQQAQDAITLSAIAYQGERDSAYEDVKAAIASSLRTFFGSGMTLVWLGVSQDEANLMYVARDVRGTNRYAVVVRGTDWDFLTDWVDDFDVLSSEPWTYAPARTPPILVARGSWLGLGSLLGMTSSVFDDASQPPMTLLELLTHAGAGGLDLLVTGHSLGGALATILGLYLADTTSRWAAPGARVGLTTYTFAAPTTGNQAYADYYDARSGPENPSWRAFRVYNENDVVPFAYADIVGIAVSGIPKSDWLTVKLAFMASAIDLVLKDRGVSYVQVGNGVPLDPSSIDSRSSCANPAATLEDFACWVAYEHASTNYMKLLGLDPGGLADRSTDMSSVAAAGHGKVESRLAAAGVKPG